MKKSKGRKDAKKRLQKKYSKKSIISKKDKNRTLSRAGHKNGRSLRGVKREEYIGVFMTTSRGFGFVRSESFEDDVFIPGSRTMGALGGDEVRFVLTGGRDERLDGEVTEIMRRNDELIIGRLCDAQTYSRACV